MSALLEYLSFGGYGFYVWGSYLVTAAVVAWEVLALRARRRRAIEAARMAAAERDEARV
jgi:heme exporter protein D